MTDRAVVVTGGVWASASKMIMVGAGFLSATLVVRLLPPFEVGIYFSVLAAVGIAALVGSLGVSIPVTTFIGESESTTAGGQRSIVIRGYVVAGIGAIAMTFIFLVGSSSIARLITDTDITVHWWVLAALSTVFVFRAMTISALRALGDIKNASIVQTLPSLIVAALLVTAWSMDFGLNLVDLLIVVGVAHLAAIATGVTMLILALRGTHSEAEAPSVKSYLAIGLPWLGTSVLIYALLQAGVLVVSATSSPAEAAQYATAFRLASLVGIPASIAVAVLPPFIARYWSSGDRTNLEKLMRSAATLAGTAAVLATILTIVAGRGILLVAFGEFYVAGWTSLVVLSLAYMIDAITGASGQMLALTGHERSVFKVFLGATPAALLVMWVLGSMLGSLGVAIGSAAGVALTNIALALIARRVTGTRTWAMRSQREAIAIGSTVIKTIRRAA